MYNPIFIQYSSSFIGSTFFRFDFFCNTLYTLYLFIYLLFFKYTYLDPVINYISPEINIINQFYEWTCLLIQNLIINIYNVNKDAAIYSRHCYHICFLNT